MMRKVFNCNQSSVDQIMDTFNHRRRYSPPSYNFVESSRRPPLSISSMAMVGNNTTTQSGIRNWTSAPSSSSPAGSDEALSHPNNTAQSNLHGVIGEHRRSSRSSSVSSGGSSGNNADSHDPSRSMQQNRLQPSSQPDQASMHILPQIEDASGKEQHLVFGTSGIQTQNGSQQSTSPSPSTELVSQIGVMPNGTDSMPVGYGMPSRTMGSSPGFPPQTTNTQRQGRPITGTYSVPQGVGNDADYARMMNDGSMATGYGAAPGPINFGPHHDVFSMASMEASLMNNPSPNSMMPAAGPFTPSPKPFPGNGSSLPYGGSNQYYYPQGGSSNNQFTNGSQSMSNSYFGGVKPSMSLPNGQPQHSAYAGAGATAPGFYQNSVLNGPTGRQNGGSTAYLYNAQQQQQQQQDFTMPPPWQGFGLSGDIIHKVTCDLCHQLYKWPHALDCLHVYCISCLVKKYDSNGKMIVCKKCNFVTSAPRGVCGLRLDYQLCSFMIKHSLQPFTCTLCTREEIAAWCCEMCSAFLCNECCDRHKDMLHFSNHEVKPISKAALHNGEYKPVCEKHPEHAENKYCVTCEVMICESCIPDHAHPNNPNSNQNYDLQEAYNIVAPRLQTWNEDAFIKYQDVMDIIKRFPDLHSIMDMRKRHSKRMVEDYADYIKTVVDQSRAAAIDQLEQAHAQMEAKVNGMVKQYSDLCTGFEGMHAFNRRTLDEGSIYDVMKNLDKMENRYKTIIGLHAEVLKCPDGISVEFKFNPNYPGTNELIHENFQMLTYKVNDVEYNISPATPNKLDPKSGRKFMDYSNGASENPDCNYQRWSSATESVSISTWNSGSERDRKNGTFIPNINRCRTRTSYIHVFGEYGRGDYAFTEPSGQAYLKDGSYVICDTNNHRIVYYSANHEFIRSIGMPDNLPPLEEQDQRGNGLRNKGFTRQENCLYFPNRVAICPITQNIVATERPPSHDIQIFTKEGEFKKCFGGNILQHPRGVTVDENGIIIVVECKVMKLVMFDQEGNFIVSHSLTKDLEFPNDVAAKAERIYISDNRGHCVQVYNYDAEFIMKIGFESVTYFPIGVSINFQNQLVVTDNHNTFNITVFDLSGKVLHIFESITKHAQCHNVAVHPSSLELMLTTKDCNVYFFNYDPNAQHPPPAAATRHSGHPFNSRRNRGNTNGGNSGYY